VRRMTNSIRRRDTTSLLIHGEVWNLPGTLVMACNSISKSSVSLLLRLVLPMHLKMHWDKRQHCLVHNVVGGATSGRCGVRL